jgi:acyl carrier protein
MQMLRKAYDHLVQPGRTVDVTRETQVYARLETIFRNVFDDETMTLNPLLSAKDVEGWDSLTHVRLMLTVEKAFNVRFSALEMGKLNNLADLVALIQTRTSALSGS